MRMILLLLAALAVSGCIAKTAVDLVTLPVRAAGQAADWATTSQDESDRNYGRKVRKQEEQDGKARKKADKEARKQAERERERERDED